MTPTTDRRHDLRLHTEDQLQGLIAHATEILRNRDDHDDATVRLARRLLSEANTELLGRGVR